DAGFGAIIIRIRYRYKGGPRKRPYAERIDYSYSQGSVDSGHVYIISSLRQPPSQPNIPNLLQGENGGEDA
ncbi:MAG TPA: hypothetical protein VEB39_06815, partial [Sphingomicrobium sp.]|nr:hypothetical protein [Sphingomicrobium sp.]